MSWKTAAIMILGLLMLYGLFTVGLPFLLAIVTAMLLEPVVALLMRLLGMGRFTAVSLVSTLFTALTLGLFSLIGAKAFVEFMNLWGRIPAYIGEASLYLEDAASHARMRMNTLFSSNDTQVQLWLENGLASAAQAFQRFVLMLSDSFLGAAAAIPNFLILFVVYLISLYLISYSLPAMKHSLLQLFDDRSREKVENMMISLRQALFGFMYAQVMMSMLTYVLTLIGLLFIRTEYPLAIALLVMFMEFVPVIGTGLVFIPWALYRLLLGDPGMATQIFLLFVVITIVRRVIEPKILSNSVGISALAAMVSLYVGFELMGVAGMFLGPLVIILIQTMRQVGLLQFKINLD
ncbi:sporulation integral membrane protein YtvI [Paenibacillus lutrae]|uniref:Sporulation integral membrane protein YtvI n=1 Tax=Paenibacillus lutrae TaxID=2078573 RepID=A0A7X3FJL5_9BACL|nr:sporulation integral membrane protein YtvI [Paenibacillus lutrae]